MKVNTSAELVKITPEVASEWLLDKWGEQRAIRKLYVSRLVADMNAGRFRTSPDAILRIKGKLANGQHRLTAIVESGKPQTCIVLESNDDDLYKVVDAGLRRTAADGLMGIGYANIMPSIARWVMAYREGNVVRSHSSGVARGSNRASVITQCEIIDYCLSNKEILAEASAFVKAMYEDTKLLPMSIGGAIYLISASKDGLLDKGKQFLKLVYMEGGNNAAGDLRNRLISNKGSKARLSNGYIFGITIKAFNSYMNGTRPGVLKWVKGEDLPII